MQIISAPSCQSIAWTDVNETAVKTASLELGGRSGSLSAGKMDRPASQSNPVQTGVLSSQRKALQDTASLGYWHHPRLRTLRLLVAR